MEFPSQEQHDAVVPAESSTTSSPVTTPERDSAAIKRLIEEVRYEEVNAMGRHYNRQHNRHNR